MILPQQKVATQKTRKQINGETHKTRISRDTYPATIDIVVFSCFVSLLQLELLLLCIKNVEVTYPVDLTLPIQTSLLHNQ